MDSLKSTTGKGGQARQQVKKKPTKSFQSASTLQTVSGGNVRPRHGLAGKSTRLTNQDSGDLGLTAIGLGAYGLDHGLTGSQRSGSATSSKSGASVKSNKPRNLPPISKSPALYTVSHLQHTKSPVPSIPSEKSPTPAHASTKRNERKASGSSPKAKPTATKHKALPQISKQCATEQQQDELGRIVDGCLQELPKQRTSIVRIFLSSTFSDFRLERNSLFKRAYPELKEFCSDLGLDFQVVDLRWGISDEATNDHDVEKICLMEIEQSNLISQGPHFVVMLGDRYGSQPLPYEIQKAEFDAFSEFITQQDRQLIDVWYKEDKNNNPAIYVLQPISSVIEHFGSGTDAQQGVARDEWSKTRKLLQKILRSAVQTATERGKLSEKQRARYFSSVTEQEIRHGLRGEEDKQRAVAFVRSIQDIDLTAPHSSKYTDVTIVGENTLCDKDMKKSRKECSEYVTSSVANENICSYKLPWGKDGIGEESHAEYAQTFCTDFVRTIKRLVSQAREEQLKLTAKQGKFQRKKTVGETVVRHVARPLGIMSEAAFLVSHHAMDELRNELKSFEITDIDGAQTMNTQVFDEILHHLHHASHTLETFAGRNQDMERVQKALFGDERKSVCIVHGCAGIGKTSLMAALARQYKQLVSESVVILRFVGKTPASSTSFGLIRSIVLQICLAYGFHVDRMKVKKYNKAKAYLWYLLNVLSILHVRKKPLILIIDAVERLKDAEGKIDTSWIPRLLHKNIQILLSVQTDSLSSLQTSLKLKFTTVDIGDLNEKEVSEFVDVILQRNKRMLTSSQMQVLLPVLKQYPQPLLMSLLMKEALTWKSYMATEDIQLHTTTTEVIGRLLSKLENKYGDIFARAVFGYITASRFGISELELEDVLSMNDEVLVSVYKYHNPPIEGTVRIPPLMLARIKYDVSEYLTQKHVYGKTVTSWSFRVFHESCDEKYVTPAKTKLHLDLARMLSVEKPYKKTIYLLNRHLNIENADRSVQIQPMTSQNSRRLQCVPYHLMQASCHEELKTQVFCNVSFLACFIQGNSTSELFELFCCFLKQHDDDDVRLVFNALKFEMGQVSEYPESIGQQIYPYLRQSTNEVIKAMTENIVALAQKPVLLAQAAFNEYSNNALRYTVQGATKIIATDDRKDIAAIATGADKIKILTNTTGDIRSISVGKDEISDSCFSGDRTRLFLLTKNEVKVYNCQEGTLLKSFKNTANSQQKLSSCICVSEAGDEVYLAGPGRLAFFQDSDLKFTAKSAMNLTGSTTTTNLMLCPDSNATLSSHVIDKRGAVAVWNVEEQRITCKMALPSQVPRGFLHRAQGRNFIIAGCNNGQIFYIDTEQSKIVNTIQGVAFHQSCYPSAFDIQSNSLLALKNSSVMSIWRMEGETCEKTGSFDVPAITTAADFNGEIAAVAMDDGCTVIYNAVTDSCTTATLDESIVDSLLVTGDDKVLTHSKDKSVKLWDTEILVNDVNSSKEASSEKLLLKDLLDVARVAMVTSKEIVIESSEEIAVWDTEKNTSVRAFPNESRTLRQLAVSTRSPNRVIFSLSTDNVLRFLNYETGEEINQVQNAFAFKLESDRLFVISTDLDGKVELLSYIISENTRPAAMAVLENLGNVHQSFSAQIVDVIDNVAICLCSWQTASNKVSQRLVIVRNEDGRKINNSFDLTKSGADVRAICLSDVTIVTLSDTCTSVWYADGKLRESAEAVKRLIGDFATRCTVSALTVSQGRHHIALGSNKGTILVLNNTLESAAKETKIAQFKAHRGKISALTFIKDGGYLVSASADKTMATWKVSDGSRLSLIGIHVTAVSMEMTSDEITMAVQVLDDKSRKRILMVKIQY